MYIYIFYFLSRTNAFRLNNICGYRSTGPLIAVVCLIYTQP